MKKHIAIIVVVLIVIFAISLPKASMATNAVSGTAKKSTPTPTKSPQKSVQGISSSTSRPSPTKSATPTQQLPIKLTKRPVAVSSAKIKRPSPTIQIVRTAGQLAAYEVSSKSGSTLIVTKKNKSSVKVIILHTTQFKQHYWGSTTLANTSVGDKVNVTGTFLDEKKTVMEAKLIRNLSILKRRGVTFGTITALSGSTISIKPKDVPVQKVTVTSRTKFIGQNEKSLPKKELKVGDRARVKGLSDRATNTITDVTEIRDFSQIFISSPSAVKR